MKATSSNGSIVDLGVNGITAQAVSNAVISTDQSAAKTTLSLAVIGQNGTSNPNTIIVPKTAIVCGATPTIYINNQVATEQWIFQDSNNYYFWYTPVFGNYELSIVFATKPSTIDFPTALILAIAVAVLISLAIIVIRKTNEASRIESIEDNIIINQID